MIITMSSRSSYYLSTLLLCFHPIFRPHALVASDTPGKLQFYDDYDCDHPSTLNPTVSLQLSVCLVTTGAEGVVIDSIPPCPQGTAAPIYYSDTACGVQTNDVSQSIFSDGCFQMAAGTNLFNAKSLMFSCQPAANNPHPSSTTTAVISALAAVATGSTGSNGGGSGSGSASGSSTSSAGSSSSTGTTTQKNNTGSTGGSSQSTSKTGSTSSSGLNTGDIIALAVGLGVGIPAIVVAILAWQFPRHFPRVRNIVAHVIPFWNPPPPPFPSSQSQQRLHGEPTQLAFQPNKFQPNNTHQQPYSHPHELAPQRSWSQQSPYSRPQEMDAQQQHFRSY